MLFVFFDINNIAHIPKNKFLRELKACTSDELAIGFMDIYHPLVIPTIHFLYQIIANETDKSDILLIPKNVQKTEPEENCIEVELTPFDSERVDDIALGGSFDHLHSGHRLLLTAAALITKRSIIVAINKAVSRKSYVQFMEPFHQRASNVVSIIYRINDSITIHISELLDVVGPAGQPGPLDALVISAETAKGGDVVLQTRKERGLPPIKIVVIPLIMMPNGEKVSSTFIRMSRSVDALNEV